MFCFEHRKKIEMKQREKRRMKGMNLKEKTDSEKRRIEIE